MGHCICTAEYPVKVSKRQIERDCSRVAEYEGDYEQKVTVRWIDTLTFKNRDEAKKYIDTHDRGWYDNLAVRFKEGRKVLWLVKYEFHT